MKIKIDPVAFRYSSLNEIKFEDASHSVSYSLLKQENCLERKHIQNLSSDDLLAVFVSRGLCVRFYSSFRIIIIYKRRNKNS